MGILHHVPSSMQFWRFRYSERLDNCLWRDLEETPINRCQRRV